MAKNAAGFVSKNKHALIEGGLAGALAAIVGAIVDVVLVGIAASL